MKKITTILWILLFNTIAGYSSDINDNKDIKDNRDLFLKLYQEEKMAYDLYGEFYERWSLSVFNIVQ
ncbi:MAG TPA: hypothetical protein DCX92_02720, partial [Bacteroidetes bacterium]|nr:hypothetical protein [Bacteroidota bacterium]